MEERNWLILGIVGIVLAVVGQILAMITVMKTTVNLGFPMTVPTMPYAIPGLAMTVLGGLVGPIGIIVWWYKRSKKVAKEVIRDAIIEAEEEKKEK